MTPARKPGPWPTLVLALVCLLLACRKSPSASVEPAEGSDAEPVASGTIMDAATPDVVREEPPPLDPARVAQLGEWVAANVEEERYLVPVERGDLEMGPHDARVTIVVFTDYQCPYCARLDGDLQLLRREYPTDVRVVVKHFPLPMHPRARIAARALIAAEVQGHGEAMNALLFAGADNLDDASLQAIAGRAGVPDLPRFWADVQDGYGDAQIDADVGLAGRLAVKSTPSFFVNGVPHRGAKSVDQLKEIYLAELDTVDRLIEAGAGRPEVYAGLQHAASPTRDAPPADAPAKPSGPRPGKPDPALHYAVPVDNRPQIGPDDALVTIIEFSDFECPYCRKVDATLDALVQKYGSDLRIVYRQQPLSMHPNAHSAALASLAADRQGKFWEMHELLFAAAEARTLGNYDDLAKQLGLDVKQFRSDMADSKIADMVADDAKLGTKFGATGTPSFFVNGRYLSGAQSQSSFEALIDEELKAAKAFKKKHKVSGSKLYETMSRDWNEKVEAPPVAEHSRETISVKQLAVTGVTKKPAITIVACADFDCPYCARGAATIEQLLADKKYGKKIAYHFAHFPLPMHPDAEAAHRAAIAAGEQGKFWEMHDLLFADRHRRGTTEFEAMAQELGLDLDQFRADSNSTATTSQLADDEALCTKLGVTGTPTYFINGRRTRGALAFESYVEIFDEELAGGFEAKR